MAAHILRPIIIRGTVTLKALDNPIAQIVWRNKAVGDMAQGYNRFVALRGPNRNVATADLARPLAASKTSSNLLGTIGIQSSMVIRAIQQSFQMNTTTVNQGEVRDTH